MRNESGDRYIRDFLRDLDQRAPQAAALLAFVAVATVAPSQLRASDVQSLHARHPLTRGVSAGVVRGIIDPEGAHDPSRGQCLGAIRPTGRPADALVFDRRLGILSWVDDAGWPTYAPPDYRDVPVVILGGPEEHGPNEGLYYAFAERQRSSVARRTIDHARRQLTPDAVASARTQVSPFDRCRTQDVQIARDERAATAMASRAIVARAAHNARLAAESDAERRRSIAADATSATTDPVSDAADRAARDAQDVVVGSARQATNDAIYETRSRVQQGVYNMASRASHQVLDRVLHQGPSADLESVDDLGAEEPQRSPTTTP